MALVVEVEITPDEECNVTVEVCVTSVGVPGQAEVINPQTLVSTILNLAADETQCVTMVLPCGQPWNVEVYELPGPTLISTTNVDCDCHEPLVIDGLTECRTGGLLGDGNDLRIVLTARGGSPVLAELEPVSGEFTRILDDTSTLSMQGVVTGRLSDSCCEGWEQVRAWATEVIVYRDGRDQWAGPVTDVAFGYGTVTIEADDLTAWWDRRTIPTLNFSNEELTDIFLRIHEEAMEPDDSMNMNVISTPTGVTGDREYNGNIYQYAGDAIKELADTGLDYTAFSRNILVGGEDIDLNPFVTMLDEYWTEPPIVRERGNEQATVVIVKGDGVQATAFAPQQYIDYYGYLVRVFEEPDIKDVPSCVLAAETRVDMLREPLFIETPTGAGLKTTAPITLEQLIPGMVIRVDTQSTCRAIVADFRLQQVTINFDGTVALDLQPLGHVADDGSVDTFVVT